MVEGYTNDEYIGAGDLGLIQIDEWKFFQSYEGEPLWYHKVRHKHHYDYVNDKLKEN